MKNKQPAINGLEDMRIFIMNNKYITLTKLAKAIGIDPGNFNKYVNGARTNRGNHFKMTMERAEKLYEVLVTGYGYTGIKPFTAPISTKKTQNILLKKENVTIFPNIKQWITEEE